MELRSGAMAGVTSHAQERGWLTHQIIGHRPVWLVTDRAILSRRRMLVDKGTLLLHVASVADQIHRRFLQEPERLPVRIVTVATEHLALEDRVM